MAGEERRAAPGPEAWGGRVTPRAPLRRAPAQPGADSDALPAAPPSPPRPDWRKVRFSDAPPEVYGDDEPPAGGDWLPGGKRSPREGFRPEAEQEEVPGSPYYLRSQRRPPRPPEPDEMTTRRVTRRQQQLLQQQQQQQPQAPASARRGLRDSHFSEEDEPSPQRTLGPTGTKKSMRSSTEVPVLIDDPISELRRPPLRSPGPGAAFQPNGNSNPSELEAASAQQGPSSPEGDEEEEEEGEEPESSDSEASSPQLRSGEALESADQIPRSSHYADRQTLQYQDFTVRDHQPSGLISGSGYPKASQEWNEQIGGIRSRRPISSGSKSSVPGGFSDDDSLLKPEFRNQRPPRAAPQASGLPKESSCSPKESSWPGPWCWALLLVAGGVVALCAWLSWTPEVDSPAVQEFQHQMQQLRRRYRGQDETLWRRSAALLEKHLNGSRPRPQPAILLLAAARDAEPALRCLAEHLADAYAAAARARRAPAIRIDGAGLAARGSGAAKLQVDQELSRGFEGGRAAAVVHRFESLPAGATLIFYKYCDHEHAAFKDVALVLTVLLEEQTLGASPDLKHVEEKVRDFLRVKFTDAGAPSAHDRMDADKLSGLWSRISHLVLPVQPERAQEHGSCL